MKALVLIVTVIITTLQVSSSAALEELQPFELAMLNKLHQPWFKPDVPQQFPRKGEYPCKRGVCKVKVKGCQDCQSAKPL